MDENQRREVALWRFAILGPLVSARLDYGDRRTLFVEASNRGYTKPSGRHIQLSPRTIETWYYAYKREGLRGLEPRTRRDAGGNKRVDPELVDLLVRAKRERPRWSIRQLIKILVRAGRAADGELHPATVHRVLRRAGVPTRAPKVREQERRSFLPKRAGDVWMGDVMHGPRALTEKGIVRKTYLISILDAATRTIVASEFRLSETVVSHEAVFKRAIAIHGCPRVYYVDRGAAYMAHSLRSICADLGIRLMHTQPRDAAAKGAIERWHRTWRNEVGSELEGSTRPLSGLNAIHHAWLERDYHKRVHTTTKRAPREHFLAEISAEAIRKVPNNLNLHEVFYHRAKRRVRKDGTVHLAGRRLEVLSDFVGQFVELRFDPQDLGMLPKVYRNGHFACDTVALDLHRNNHRKRRSLPAQPTPVIPTKLDPLGDLEREHYFVDPPTTELF